MALSYTKNTWSDTAASGTAITADKLNAYDEAIASLTSKVNDIDKKLTTSTVLYQTSEWHIYTFLNVVVVSARQIIISNGSWSSLTCSYTIPSQYRPKYAVNAAMVTTNGGSVTGCLQVDGNGTIHVFNYGSSGSSAERYGTLAYIF